MNFFVNQAMGLGNSGVEHAEFYRAKRFEQAGLDYRFVFLSLIPELHQAIDKWHLKAPKVLNLWEYLVLGGDYLKTGLKRRMPAGKMVRVIDSTNTHRKTEQVLDSGIRVVEHLVKHPDKHKKNTAMLVVRSARCELFDEASGQRKVMFERIDDPNRHEVLTNIHLYAEQGQHLFFRNAVGLYRYFFKLLDEAYQGKSNFLIDRGELTDQALTEQPLVDAKLIYIVHADQLSNRDDPKYPLWNDHYEYMLDNLARFDRVVVATALQRQDMLIDFPNAGKKFAVIPVGGIDDGAAPLEEKTLNTPLRLITASRLASEKHIDIAVKAVAELHQRGVQVTFDIYGLGEEMASLKKLIKERHAEAYVHLQGLSDHLATVYPHYDAFVSASFSEGFGLTYIEALNAGLPVVTFDARFGARQMIKSDVNGYLQPFKRDDVDFNVAQIVQALEKLVKNYPRLRAHTRESVAGFQNHLTAAKWRKFIDELRAD